VYLEQRITRLAQGVGVYPIVSSRPKSLESFAEKIQRQGKNYTDPLNQLTDLCGVRVITHTLDEVDLVVEAIKQEADLRIDHKHSVDQGQKLRFSEFGYLSKHYILKLTATPRELQGSTHAKAFVGMACELQLRTLAQHSWSAIYHELGYKNEFQLPTRLERDFARAAALLEQVDLRFDDLKRRINLLGSSYGAYMTKAEITRLAQRLEILLEVDPETQGAYVRLIRARKALGEWDQIIKLWEDPDVRPRLERGADTLRDVGVAHCQVFEPDQPEFKLGQKLMLRAVERNARDVDAYCSLGGSYKRAGQHEEALRWYRRAYELDPSDPYAVGNVITESMICKQSLEILGYLRAAIDGARERCEEYVDTKVNMPWALFDRGMFELYRGRGKAALCSYAEGVTLAHQPGTIETALRTLQNLQDRFFPVVRHASGNPPPVNGPTGPTDPTLEFLANLPVVVRFLRLALDRHGQAAHPAASAPAVVVVGEDPGLPASPRKTRAARLLRSAADVVREWDRVLKKQQQRRVVCLFTSSPGDGAACAGWVGAALGAELRRSRADVAAPTSWSQRLSKSFRVVDNQQQLNQELKRPSTGPRRSLTAETRRGSPSPAQAEWYWIREPRPTRGTTH
jgi:ppGpp synthetase/RelA/SpoT-type nucleotidyltranferase